MAYANQVKLSNCDIRAIFKMRDSGVSLRKIAEHFSVSYSSVRWRLKFNAIGKNNHVLKTNRQKPKTRLGCGKFDYQKFIDHDRNELAYWAGFIMADAGVETANRRLSIDLSCADGHHLGWWKQFNVDVKTYHNGKSNAVRIYHPLLMKWLKRWDVSPQKTGREIFPIRRKKTDLLHWIRGLIDGDGSVRFTGKDGTGAVQVSIGSASSQLLTSVQEFLDKYHIRSIINSEITKHNHFYYKITFNQRMSRRLYKLLGHGIRLERKWSVLESIKDRRTQLSDEEVGKIFKLRKKCLSIRKIAKIINRSPSTVRYYLKGKSKWATAIL